MRSSSSRVLTDTIQDAFAVLAFPQRHTEVYTWNPLVEEAYTLQGKLVSAASGLIKAGPSNSASHSHGALSLSSGRDRLSPRPANGGVGLDGASSLRFPVR